MTALDDFAATFDVDPGYLDWAAFGPLTEAVRREAAADAELLGTGRRSSIDLVASRGAAARAHLARLLDADDDDVVLQPSTTHGLMQALYGLSGGLLHSVADFPGITLTAARAAALRPGVIQVQRMNPPRGFMTPEAVREALTPETAAVVVSLVDFRTGYLADLGALRDVIGDRLLIVDAVQGFGVVDADYGAADVICGNGYKWLRAGRGTGWACYRPEAVDRLTPVLSGFAGVDGDPFAETPPPAARSARGFTVNGENYLAAGRLATALGELDAVDVADIAGAVADRADELVRLADRYGIPLATPHERERRAGIVALAPGAFEASGLVAALANRGVAFTARSGLIRLSVHVGTEIDGLTLAGDAMADHAAKSLSGR